jgi:hypothetical protein
MQTDDILILADQSFVVIEEEALITVKIMIKPREQLILNNALKFNNTRIERFESNEIEIIYFRQETHIQEIQLIKIEFIIITSARDKIRTMLILRNQYIAQRVRGTYCYAPVPNTSTPHLVIASPLSDQAKLAR